jgi:hypothetical protein
VSVCFSISALSASRFSTLGAALVFRLMDHRGRLERGAEPLPDFLAGRGDVDVAVGGLENSGRNARGVVVAGLRRHLAAEQPARALEVEHEYLRLQQRGGDVLALFDLSRSSNATRMPSAQNSPAQRSRSGCRRTGPAREPGRHQPAMPCAI